jgi:hypothetical protein
MDWILRLVLGILGTGILLYLSWFLYLLHSDPWALWKMNKLNGYSSSVTGKPITLSEKAHDKLKYVKFGIIIIAACFSAYHVAYWCLGWMPDDWVKRNEDGDWVTVRSSLSIVFSVCGGLFLAAGVGRGVNGRVAEDTYRAETILRDQIDDAHSVEELIKLRDNFELAKNDGACTLSKRHNDIYSKFAGIFPDQKYERRILWDASTRINKRLSTLKSMGVDVQE